MNLFGKTGTKKLSKRMLAALLAVVLVATQFLTTAVWSFADTSSPEGTQYNVVLDADLLTADDSFDPATAVSKVTANALSGNAYAWNMTAANYLIARFPATGYSDEVALVMWIDTTAQTEDVNVLLDMGDGSDFYTVAGDADDNGMIFTIPADDPEGGLGVPAVSDEGVITIPAGLSGWLMIPFESFNGTVDSGSITAISFTTGATGAIYLDDIGFASGNWSEDFYISLLMGTLTANRRARCEVYGHDWLDATCTAPKTCKYCSVPEGLAKGHTWDIDDCAQDRVCIICNAPEAAKNHSYVSDGDCFTADQCGSCSAVQPDSELGHHFADATCTEPKTCEGCGATEGSALGHDWYMGTCKTCLANVYTVAEDFEDADVTGPADYWSLVADKTPFGQALQFGRAMELTEFGVVLDKAGTADDKAIVFYYDNTGSGSDGEAYFNFIPYTVGGCGMTLGTSYTYHAVIDGEVVTLHPSSNFSLRLPKQSKGWVVLPLPAENPNYTWSSGGGDGKYYGTTKDIGRIYLAFPEFHNASAVIDQIGFTADVAQFEAFAAAGNVNLNGCTDYKLCENDNHAWEDANCYLPKICSVCGLAQGLPTGIHNYKDATCSSPKTCFACGATEGVADESLHIWKNANCGYPKTCETCGKTEGETVGEHDWKNPTCDAPKTCNVCGKTEGAALGHTWGTDDKCTVCGSTRPLYVIGENFEGASSDDYVNGTVLGCGSIFGSSLQVTHNASLGSGTAAVNFQHIMFDTVGTKDHEALVFFFDNTASSAPAKLAFAPLSADGYGTTVKGGHPVTTIINGVLTVDNTTIVTENFTMVLPANSSGWVMLSLGRNGTSNWGLWGGNAPKTTEGIAGFAVRADSGTTVILDQFGFVESMDTFAAKAVLGNENIPGYTGVAHDWQDANCGYAKTCKNCGKTEGDRVGTHNWVAGTCTVCDRKIYNIAENFDDAAVTGSEGAWELVADKTPFGQALKYNRLGDNCIIKIDFDVIGTAEGRALVFYFDNTESGFDGEAPFRLRPYVSGGRFATMGGGYTYYTVINGVMTANTVTDNMNLRLPKKSSGWVVLPFPQYDYTWPGDGDGTWDESLNDIAGMELTYIYYAGASLVIDQIGFADDADTFLAAALAGNSNIPGYVSSYCEQNGHSWTTENCGVGSVCSVCNIPNPDKPATGAHKWVGPTCGADGYCEVCGAIDEANLATGNHDWAAATCGVDGYCKVCKQKNENNLATGNHNLVEETCGAPEYCKVCHQTFTPATGAHDWENATCTSPKTCKVCQLVEGSAPGHVWGNDKICDVCGGAKTVCSIAQGFESNTANVTDVVDGTIKELVTGKTDFGQALKFGRTTTAGGLRINFDVMGRATDKALVFWYDNTGSGFNGDASMWFIPRDNNGWGTTLSTTYTYYTVINGKVASASPSSNFNLKLAKGTKGWVIVPLGSDITGTWGYGGGTAGTSYMGNTCENLAAVDVRFEYYNDASVVLDQFGFVEDIQAFMDCATYGNLNIDGYTGAPSSCTEHTWTVANCGQPKHCTECGLVDGVRTGEHDWNEADCENAKNCTICFTTEGEALGHDFVDGFCSRCELEVGDYEVVMDFDGRDPTNISNKACTYVVAGTGYKGNAMILDRGATAGLNSSQVRFKPTGNAEDEALVFFMDASHNVSVGGITLYVYDNGTTRCLKPTAGATIYAIDVKGKKTELTVSDNNNVPFELGFEGWYVIPFSAITTNHWGSGTLELTPGTVNELFLGYGGVPGSLFEMDNFGFTTDTDKFIAEAVAGKVNSDVYGEAEKESNIGKPLPGMGGGQEEYVPDLSNPSPSDYNPMVDFDDKMYVNLVDHETQQGNAGYSIVTSPNQARPSYKGNALYWNRGTDGTVTRVEMDVTPTGYSDENTFVFWINTKDMVGSGHPITLLLYGENADDGSEVCMRLGNGSVYRLISTQTKKITDRVCAADGALFLPSGFEGFVAIPFAALESHWGGMGVKIKPGTIHRLWMYHGYTYGEELYIDNIGTTHNIENFGEKVLAGTLNATNKRVDVGSHILPLPEGAGVSDTNLSGGADGKTADSDFFHTLTNFNSKVPTVNESNSYIKLVKESPSGYGSGLNWFKMDDTLATEISLTTEGGLAGDQGIALWISTKDSGNSFDTKIRFMPHDFVTVANGSKERCWRLIDNAAYYLVKGDVATEEMVTNSQMVSIPGGFEGWLIVPFASLEVHWGTPEGQKPEDQKLDPTTLKILNLYYGNQAVTEYIHIDEYGLYTHARKFIESIGAKFPVPPMNGAIIQSLDRTYGEGGIGNNATVGKLAWSDKAQMKFNGDVSNDSYSLSINATAGTQVHFPIDIATNEEDPYGIQAENIPKMKNFTGLGFWINTEKAVDLTLSILQSNGKTLSLNPTGKISDIYRLVDENATVTKAYQFSKDNTIHIPAKFTGWVVVDTAVFQSGVDMSLLKEVIVTFKSNANVLIDSVRNAKSAVSLITKQISYPMDTDLLVSSNEKLVSITVDEEGELIITLAENMDSTRFRKIVDVRGGYREVFNDDKGAQMFGKVDLMSNVGGIKVYLADTMMASYEVRVVGFEKDKNGYDIDGDGIIDGIGVDIDGDGKFDGVGADFNGDGVFDGVWMDIDGDGIVDGVDLDLGYGFDGILDGIDLNGDWRADGIDLDGDGIIDGVGIDLDFDGIYEGVLEGIDVDGDEIWDGVDMDLDGVLDYYDIDGNGICDGIGIDMDGDGKVDVVVSGVDFDGDGIFDGVDNDLDGYSDGIALDLDADGNYDGVGIDRNGDGIVDAMAIDLDGDGVFDGVDIDFDGVIDENYNEPELDSPTDSDPDGGDQPTDTDKQDEPVEDKDGLAWWIYVIIGAGALLVAAAVVTILLLKRKAKASASEAPESK